MVLKRIFITGDTCWKSNGDQPKHLIFINEGCLLKLKTYPPTQVTEICHTQPGFKILS